MVILSNLPPPTEGVRFQQPQTSAVIESQQLGPGTLYVAESCLSWVGSDGNGFSLQYPAISLHAVSRDRSSYPEECIFVMVEAPASERRRRKKCNKPVAMLYEMTNELADCDIKSTANGEVHQPSSSEGSSEMFGGAGANVGTTGASLILSNGTEQEAGEEVGDTEETEESPITQIRFIPLDKSVLDDIFKAMADCQALHPDENESFSEEEPDEEEYYEESGGGDFFTSAEDVEHLDAAGQAVLQRLNQAAGDTEPMDDQETMEVGQSEDAPQPQ